MFIFDQQIKNKIKIISDFINNTSNNQKQHILIKQQINEYLNNCIELINDYNNSDNQEEWLNNEIKVITQNQHFLKEILPHLIIHQLAFPTS